MQLNSAVVVGPTNSFGETPVVRGAAPACATSRGGIVIRSTDFNPERIVLDNRLVTLPTANVGDTLTGAIVGVLDYGFGNFTLNPTVAPTVTSGGLTQETTSAATAGQLAAATFNVENLDPGDPQSKFDQLAAAIVTNLRAPDLLALEEVQDNDGPTNSSVVAADQTLAKLVAAITAAGGPAYSWRQINPVDDADGGEPGGNIRVAFLYRTDRGLSLCGPSRWDVHGHHHRQQRRRGAAAQLLAGPGRPDQLGLVDQPQAARGRVHLWRPDRLRHREPFQLQGRRRPAVWPLPAADALVGDPAPPASHGAARASSTRSSPSTRARRWSCWAT